MENNNLHHIKSSGFKTPDNYFESFDEKLLNKLHSKNHLESITDSGFNVPNDYFKTLDNSIINKIKTENETKVISLFSWKKLAYASTIAASLALMFTTVFNSSKKLTFDTLKTASIENYLIEEDFTTAELSALLTDDELYSENFANTNIPESALEDYLLNNTNIEDLLID